MSDDFMNQFKVLLCTVPDGPLATTISPTPEQDKARPFQATLGIQSLVHWMGENGFSDCYEYYDINNLRPSDEALQKRFAEVKPTVVGLSAPLSHCYPNVKRICATLREMFPDVWIVVGGHITASSKVILTKTEADLCVVGDGEIAWLELLKYFKTTKARSPIDEEKLKSIKGVSFFDNASVFQFFGYGQQLPANELNFIDFDFMKSGLHDRPELFQRFFPLSKDTPAVNSALIDKESPLYIEGNTYDPDAGGVTVDIPTSKGCVAKCTFCQRYTKGYRVYDIEKMEEYILNIKEKYKVDLFSIADENFGSNIKQAYQIAKLFKKCGVYWLASGVRCTSVTYDDLKFFKDNNCIYIKFGIESGSQTILDVMEKKFSCSDVFEAVENCNKVGLSTTPDVLMLGMPGESQETIIESSRLVAKLRYLTGLDASQGDPFWAKAFPGTPLYEYAQQIGIIGTSIDEEEKWLYRLTEDKTGLYNYNNQTGADVKSVFFWGDLYSLEGKRSYLKLLVRDNMGLFKKMGLIYNHCIKPEVNTYVYQLKSLHNKKATFYVGENMSIKRKLATHSVGAIRFILSLANFVLPRSIVYPLFKRLSDMKYDHIKKTHKATIGKLSLFQEQTKPNPEMLITASRLRGKKRQQERSLRFLVKENRSKFSPQANEVDETRVSLSSGQ